MKILKSAILVLTLLLSGFLSLNGQISAPDSDFSDTTDYRIDGKPDDIFVFYSPGETQKGSLRATGPSPGNFQFDWSSFDTLSQTWNPLSTESGVTFSEINNLEEGAYQLRISNGVDVDTTFRAWVHLNSFNVLISSDSQDRIKFGKYFCGVLYLNASINIDTFFYYNLDNGERIFKSPKLDYEWTSDNPAMTIFNAKVGYESKSIENPPFEDTWFILTAEDYSGMSDQDSVFYESIEVKSEFSMEFYDKKETMEFIEPPSNQDDAPLTVRFTNKSVNGFDFEWIYSDSIGNFGSSFFANYKTMSIDEQPEFTYKIPDDYYPMLVAKSEEGCIDTFKVEEAITVLPSELEAPNVFSPEGLEANRYFKVSFQSIKEFHLRIYSRTGNLVYKADVTDMYDWEGWNGNIMNSDRPAPPGIYYYIIEATGYDEERYNDGLYKGVVYLFRPKN